MEYLLPVRVAELPEALSTWRRGNNGEVYMAKHSALCAIYTGMDQTMNDKPQEKTQGTNVMCDEPYTTPTYSPPLRSWGELSSPPGYLLTAGTWVIVRAEQEVSGIVASGR